MQKYVKTPIRPARRTKTVACSSLKMGAAGSAANYSYHVNIRLSTYLVTHKVTFSGAKSKNIDTN